MSMDILFKNEHYAVIDKPPGFHVHPPENSEFPVPRSKVCLYRLRDTLKQRVYPVHRIDVATSGLLMMALSSEASSRLNQLFRDRMVSKSYWAVVRGFVQAEASIDMPLELDSTGDLVDALTSYRRLKQIELPEPVGKRHGSARYSWLEVSPHTGRFHQIRRHFNRISHPVVGDREHGDSHHNRFFREKLGIPGLCLRAQRLSFVCPWRGQEVSFEAPLIGQWKNIEELFLRYGRKPV